MTEPAQQRLPIAPPAVRIAAVARMTVSLVRLPVTTRRSHGIGDVADSIDTVILRLETGDGLVGWGEAAPWALFTGTGEANAAALDRYLRPLAVGSDPRRIGETMARAESALVGHPEAKAALETALLDILGKAAGLPVAELLGGRCRDSIPLSVSLADPDFGADLALAERLVEDGIGIFKLKAGFAEHAFDVERLESLRERFPTVALRVDYNQGLVAHEALRRLRDIGTFAPDFIEQPLPADQWDGLADLARNLATPILADESVFTPVDALRAAQQRIADLFSIKIMKSGGLRRARTVAEIGAAAGIACYGGDMFETGLAHLAGAHLIAATPNISLGCEFYQARYYLAEDILAAPFPIEDGAVVVPTAPGLGIAVDETAVKRHALETRDGS